MGTLDKIKAENLWKSLNEENLNKNEILEFIKNGKPELIAAPFEGELPGYEGRLPLHLAIAREEVEIVQEMLKAQDHDSLKKLFQKKATGKEFQDSVMSGQIPLSIAALTFNKKMISLLLNKGADIDFVNSYEENVFHSLVRYSNQENLKKIWDTILFLCYECQTAPAVIRPMWRKVNVEGHTPLTLSVLCGQNELFGKIISLQGIFERSKCTEGMSDVKEVDITQIDTLAYEHFHNRNLPPNPDDPPQPKAVIKVVFALDQRSTENFVDHYAIRKCIKAKWKTYRISYYLWAFFHLLLVSIVSMASIKRVGGLEWLHASASWIPLIFNLLYALLKLVTIYHQIKYRCSMPKGKSRISSLIHFVFNELHDGSYVILLGVSALAAAVDHIWFFTKFPADTPTHAFLTFVLLSDFCFILFFVRTWKHFSFFTVMIQRVIFRDIVRFLFFIAVNVVAFTVILFAVLNVPQEGQTGDHFINLMVALISLMLGLDDVSLSTAREPGLARFVYYLFVVSCYIIALNLLIALMSGTCDELNEKRLLIWKVQMLSVIVFLDNIRFLPQNFRGMAGEPDDNHRTWITVTMAERQPTYGSLKKPKLPKMTRTKTRRPVKRYSTSAISPTLEITNPRLDL